MTANVTFTTMKKHGFQLANMAFICQNSLFIIILKSDSKRSWHNATFHSFSLSDIWILCYQHHHKKVERKHS